jgi:hypothetical protein
MDLPFWGEEMKLSASDLKSVSIDELWALHEEVGKLLSEQIVAENADLNCGSPS